MILQGWVILVFHRSSCPTSSPDIFLVGKDKDSFFGGHALKNYQTSFDDLSNAGMPAAILTQRLRLLMLKIRREVLTVSPFPQNSIHAKFSCINDKHHFISSYLYIGLQSND
jgi:hypothetical protein